ncbi:hypothetical protein LMJ41_05720 [Streptomyces globisporus]|nr:hypothetical protein [Streptomyces globisporus]
MRDEELPVEGDPSRLTLTGRNTVAEWLAHPVGGPLLMKAFAEGRAAAGGGPSAWRTRRSAASSPGRRST